MEENKKLKQALFLFKVCYLLYLLLAFNAFVNGTAWMYKASYVITVAGAGMILWMLFQHKQYRKGYNLWILTAFVVSYMISAAAHLSYGVTENVKGLIWLVIPIAVIYFSAFAMSGKEICREIKWISAIYICYCTVANLISLSMVYWGRKYDYIDETGTAHGIGYRWERLWGVYDDPNHGATITIVALFMLVYLFYCMRKLWQRIGLSLLFIINFLYVALSDSRTAIVSLAAGIVFGGCLLAWIRKKSGTLWKRVLVPILGALLAAGIVLAGDVGVKAVYRPVNQKMEETVKAQQPALQVKKVTGAKKETRENDLKEDYSNGRIEIWKNGLQIIQKSPVIGVGFRNIQGYTKKYFPEGYLVKNAYDVKYDSMHNLELDILVGQGVLGEVIFIALLVNICIILLKRVHLVSPEYRAEAVFSTSAAVALLAAGTFLSFIFYVNAPQNMCFWLFLGYAMRFCQIGAEEHS